MTAAPVRAAIRATGPQPLPAPGSPSDLADRLADRLARHRAARR
ncbi:hypothetical protein EV659_109113 [Rhodothalassium salexigens DSM 2132]|uniref:Uncharacterized protein n=1 Tax=Rhodothalassium salexigens DSM 2132 TaxID=1188247 RepID=A0A4R2PBV8_RHOSA|nr:hypothetical protein [Rhodothalassium salexigens DSM 2132]TCP32620.1 hypothetical protein EV659_109113 [Rhodothalassium salexigens DSM 2132]